MIDLKKAKLPQAIKVGGSFYKIKTDFRFFLILQDLLKDKETPINGFDFMYLTPAEIPPSRLEGIRALVDFMNPPAPIPRRTGEERGESVLDYELDADYIYAAFMEQYGINLATAPLHWYEFQALLKGLHNTKLNDIIGYRLFTNDTGRNDKWTKHQQKLYEAWRLPQKGDDAPDEALEEFESQLYKR